MMTLRGRPIESGQDILDALSAGADGRDFNAPMREHPDHFPALVVEAMFLERAKRARILDRARRVLVVAGKMKPGQGSDAMSRALRALAKEAPLKKITSTVTGSQP